MLIVEDVITTGNHVWDQRETMEFIDLEKKYKLFDLIIKFMVVSLTDDELERALGKNDKAEGEGDGTEKISKFDEE